MVIELPEDQFKNKKDALQNLLERSLPLLSDRNQKMVIELPEDQFTNKKKALQNLLERSLPLLFDRLQKMLIKLPEDQFTNKKAALQKWCNNDNLSEDTRNILLLELFDNKQR